MERPRSSTEKGQELVITPAVGIPQGHNFDVVVAYDGHPNWIADPDKSRDGWIPTDDGAFVANEPQGSPTWYPANDTPNDKATFDVSITVPHGRTAIGNGVLVSHTDNGENETWHWRETVPMATYPRHHHERRVRDPLRHASGRAASLRRGRPAVAP